jgi:Na+/citrate or Na+/malate symporter
LQTADQIVIFTAAAPVPDGYFPAPSALLVVSATFLAACSHRLSRQLKHVDGSRVYCHLSSQLWWQLVLRIDLALEPFQECVSPR